MFTEFFMKICLLFTDEYDVSGRVGANSGRIRDAPEIPETNEIEDGRAHSVAYERRMHLEQMP